MSCLFFRLFPSTLQYPNPYLNTKNPFIFSLWSISTPPFPPLYFLPRWVASCTEACSACFGVMAAGLKLDVFSGLFRIGWAMLKCSREAQTANLPRLVLASRIQGEGVWQSAAPWGSVCHVSTYYCYIRLNNVRLTSLSKSVLKSWSLTPVLSRRGNLCSVWNSYWSI